MTIFGFLGWTRGGQKNGWQHFWDCPRHNGQFVFCPRYNGQFAFCPRYNGQFQKNVATHTVTPKYGTLCICSIKGGIDVNVQNVQSWRVARVAPTHWLKQVDTHFQLLRIRLLLKEIPTFFLIFAKLLQRPLCFFRSSSIYPATFAAPFSVPHAQALRCFQEIEKTPQFQASSILLQHEEVALLVHLQSEAARRHSKKYAVRSSEIFL